MEKEQKQIKLALFAMAATFFGIGVTEFISVGVLPAVAKSFDVSTSTAGLITSIYALGAAIGAPLLTLLTANINKKKTIVTAILVFVIGHLIIGLSVNFSMLLFGRFIAALAHGLLFALSSAIAAELVGDKKQASAIAFIFGGFTLATAIGAPLGTSVGDMVGWRIPFLFIAVLGVVALILNLYALPNNSSDRDSAATLKEQLKLAFHHHVLMTMLVTILGYGGTFATFTYLSPILKDITHYNNTAITILLVVYGISIAIGNYIGGKIGSSSGKTLQQLSIIFLIQAVALFLFYYTQHSQILSVINIIILGLLAFMSVPILQSYILNLSSSYVPSAVTMASSLNITSFNLGIVLGAYVGGEAIDYMGLNSTALAATVMVVLSLIVIAIMLPIENKRLKKDI